MSTLKSINVIHPSSAVNNIVNDASGNVAVGNNLTVAGTSTISGNETVTGTLVMGSSFKRNRIINGNMLIDQRNAGASTTPAASGYLLDRFAWTGSIGSKLTFGQNLNSVTPPLGFTKYLGAQTASATTPSATEFYSEYQVIEGYNMADFGWGSASAKTATLSFIAYSSLTGTFGGSIYNSAGNRCYPFSYSIPVANTWTTISVTVTGDTTGTWATDNTAGMVIMWGLGAGASVSGTAGAWGSTLYRSSTGAVQVVATAGATFYVTGVQLEVGTKATPYEMQIYSDQLAQCQRYYQKNGDVQFMPYTTLGNGVGGVGVTYLPTVLRTNPTYTISGGAQATSFAVASSGVQNLVWTGTGTGAGNPYFTSYTASAEL
jgi:hypothetical protein